MKLRFTACLISLTTFLLTATLATAQTDIAPTWKISPIEAPNQITYDWFEVGALVCGMTYNPVTNHLIVLKRGSGTNRAKLYILDADTGAQLGQMSTLGITADTGSAELYRITCGENGVLYACNYASGSTRLRIYRYETETSDPHLVFTSRVTPAMGFNIDVAGTGNDTRLLISNIDGSTNKNKIPVFTTDDGGLNFTMHLRTVASGETITGTNAVAVWDSNGIDYYAKRANTRDLHKCIWNPTESIDASVHIEEPFGGGTSGFDLWTDSSNPSDRFIAYAMGAKTMNSPGSAIIKKVSDINTVVYNLTHAGGNADGTVCFTSSITSPMGISIIRGDIQAAFFLNIGNSIVRYDFTNGNAVPVTLSGFSVE